ncbi:MULTISPECIES: TIGR01777 family oxidoreductase [Paenibacillus]|uniref:TIGR01777 family oxidoreductase n=1 Tax=Paenibacillus TaxID=44249 RepID=UPI00096F35A7|nr:MULTISPECIES: TIGR01777 family oxidoreductase [Paenibacillus]MCP3744446.1 TIGR01777 family oxidoreductase [Paenibacillus sp. A3M_27_13]OMF82711.1 TIGR01777 family protein [Paenibacillus peoriae]
MNIIVCGGTGLVGSALVKSLLDDGYTVKVVTRKPLVGHEASPRLQYMSWNELKQKPEVLEGTDAVVNLAGETLNQRWTDKSKQRILQSRLLSVARLAQALNALQKKPKVIIQASAVAAYGTSLTETFDETSPRRSEDFLSQVVEQWEEAANAYPSDARLIKLRISLVLDRKKGAFPLMKIPYSFGFGGKIGSGHQWMSWIHIEDIVRLITYCIHTTEIVGAVNASSPHPLTNDQFGRTVAMVYHRPHWFPVPGILVQKLLGEMSTLVLDGQKVLPHKALEHGFKFNYPSLKDALEELHSSQKQH